jgi:hypothetical protein
MVLRVLLVVHVGHFAFLFQNVLCPVEVLVGGERVLFANVMVRVVVVLALRVVMLQRGARINELPLELNYAPARSVPENSHYENLTFTVKAMLSFVARLMTEKSP